MNTEFPARRPRPTGPRSPDGSIWLMSPSPIQTACRLSGSPYSAPMALASDEIPILEPFVLGPYQTNCYLVRIPGHPGCWFVDGGFDPGEMIDRARELNLAPRAIVLTHAHLDHIAGVNEVLRAFPGTPVLIHEAEKDWLR